MATAEEKPNNGESVLRLLNEASSLCRKSERPDLARGLDIAAARIGRPTTVVCVVGEYKQGKSHVINALVGRQICVVDDDLATAAITVIGSGDQPAAFVHRVADGERTVEEIGLADLPLHTIESADGEFPTGIDLVEVAVPSPQLERGLAVVDTPGVNAFRTGSEGAVLDFLQFADGMILVSDASAEISRHELAFLRSARGACPTVLVALSKIDLYPEWRRIAELDRGHLGEIGLHDSVIPISSTLQSGALAEQDAELDGESGFSSLRTAIADGVLDIARHRAVQHGRGDLLRSIEDLKADLEARLTDLEDPEKAEQRLVELKKGREAVARMRTASAKWAVALNDGIGDLRQEVDYRLRTSIRGLLQESDRALADADPKEAWESLIEELKASVAEEAEGMLASIRDRTEEVALRIADMIAEDAPEFTRDEAEIDIEELWQTTDRDPTADSPSMLASGLTVMRGGYSGMLMLGMLINLTGIAALGPLTLGAGALFGVKQYRDERKRHMDKQRHEAKTIVRQFLDSVQIELGTRSRLAVQDGHRALRDHFDLRIRDLSARYARAVSLLEETLASDDQHRAQTVVEIRTRLGAVDALRAAVNEAGGPS